MPLLNPDGSPYRASGTNQQYNSGSKELFDFYDQEAIEIGGSKIFYYECFIPSGEIDTDYWEARGKLFSEHPIELWANYEPMPAQNHMSAFGMDSLNEIVLEVNATAAVKAIGHMPKIGSRIYTPHLGENWEIIQRNLGEFKMWNAIRLQIICRQFQESVTTSGGKVTEKSPNINKGI